MIHPIVIDEEDWSDIDMTALYLLHTVSIIFLSFDYIFINSIPFTRRHILPNLTIGFAYLFLNLGYTLNYEPLYPMIDWKSPTGIILPLCVVIVFVILSLLLECCTRIKLK